MEVIRYGNDINVTWSVYGRNGSKYSLSDKVRHLWLVNGPRKREITSYSVQGRNQLVFVIDNGEINRLGAYKLLLQIREPDSVIEDSAYDLTQVFQIVSETYPLQTNKAVDGQCDVSFKSVLKNTYISELEGESAYEIAVRHGFDGTEQEWLESLIGVRSVTQSASSQESGGLNKIAFTLADGSVSEISVYNGERGEEGNNTLSGLSDTAVSSPVSGQFLKWNGTRWVNAAGNNYSYGSGIRIANNVISADIPGIASGLIAAGYSLNGEGGGQSGVTTLRALSDVSLVSPVDGQVLTYDASISKWVAKTVPTGGGDSGGGGGGGEGGDGDFDPTILDDYVTIAQPETITGAKTFAAPITVGSGENLAPEAETATKRIYFGAGAYIELNTNGFYFYGAPGVYTNGFMSAGGLSSGGSGGGGGVSSLYALNEVQIDPTQLSDGQVLAWDEELGYWVAASVSGVAGDYLPLTGGDMAGNIFMPTGSSTNSGPTLNFRHMGTSTYVFDGYVGANSSGTLAVFARNDIRLRPGNSSDYGLVLTTSDVTFNNVSIRKTVFYGTCNNSGNARTADCPDFKSSDLRAGTVLYVYMKYAIDSSNTVTLTVTSDGTAVGTKTIYPTEDSYTAWLADEIVCFVFDGTFWMCSPTVGAIKGHMGGSTPGTSYSAGEGINISGSTIKILKATNSSLGGLKLNYAATTANGSGVNKDPTVNPRPSTRSGKLYWIEMNSAGKLFVDVPWESGGGGGTAGVTSIDGHTGAITAATMKSIVGLDDYVTKATAQTISGEKTFTATNLYANNILPNVAATKNLGASGNYWGKIYLGKNGNKDVYLQYDSSANALRLYNAGFAADSFVSAGGVSAT